MGNKIVIALGGNALGNTPSQQNKAAKSTAKYIVDLIEAGKEVIVTHGNGPQVGIINSAMEAGKNSEAKTPEMPFPECGAMSQGYIGYHLQNAIGEELRSRNIDKSVATLITQVIVNKNDEAFHNPTKPIGIFYNKKEADILKKEKGYNIVEDAGRGYRRVVPSPLPIGIVEEKIIKSLFKEGHVLIAVGGGGIPVVEEDGVLIGVPAVIDKDFASEKLAEVIEADYLIILTSIEKVAINFGKPDVKWLDNITVEEARKYANEGNFAPGSMLPKVEAAIKFAMSKPGRRALITSLQKAKDGIEGKTGTVISAN